MARRLTKIEALDAPGGTVVTTTGGRSDLFADVEGTVTLKKKTGQFREASFKMMLGSPFVEEFDAFFLQHQTIRFTYDDASETYWRLERGTNHKHGQASSVDLVDYGANLASRRLRITRTPSSFVDLTLALTGLTAQQALSTILDPLYNVHPLFQAGAVEAGLDTVIVALEANLSTHLNALYALADQLAKHNGNTPARLAVVWNSIAGTFDVNINKREGWSASEIAAGEPDPALRLVDEPATALAPGAIKRNRKSLTRRVGHRDFFNRMIPVSGTAQEPRSIAGARFEVTAATIDGGTTMLTLADPAVPDGLVLNAVEAVEFGTTVAETDVFFPLTRPAWADATAYALDDVRYNGSKGYRCILAHTSDPDKEPDTGADWQTYWQRLGPFTLVVTGAATGLVSTRSHFRRSTDGSDLVFLDNGRAAEEADVVERAVAFAEIPPYDNLVELAGASADFSKWAAGQPVGWGARGFFDENLVGHSPTITQVFEAQYVRHGLSSMKVQCDVANLAVGNFVSPFTLDLRPTTEEPYFSLYVSLMVESGTVGVYLVDAGGTVYPDSLGERAESSSSVLRALVIEGVIENPAEGPAAVYFIARTDSTVFYVDAVAVVQSASAWEYRKLMGARGTWLAGVDELARQSSLTEPTWSGEMIDLKNLVDEAGQEAVDVGSHVRVRGQFSSGVPGFQVDAEVVELQVEEDRIQGQIHKKIALATPRDNAARRLVSSTPASLLPEAPNKTGGAAGGTLIAQGSVQFGRRDFVKEVIVSGINVADKRILCFFEYKTGNATLAWVDRQMSDRFYVRTNGIQPGGLRHGSGSDFGADPDDGVIVRWLMFSDVASRDSFDVPRLIWPPVNPAINKLNLVNYHHLLSYSVEEVPWTSGDPPDDFNTVLDFGITAFPVWQELEGWWFFLNWTDAYIDTSFAVIASFARSQSAHLLEQVGPSAFATSVPWPEFRAEPSGSPESTPANKVTEIGFSSEFLFHPHDTIGEGYFRWQPAPGAVAYDLDYSDEASFPPPPATVEIRGLTMPAYRVEGLSPDEEVNWRVRALDQFGGTTPWVARQSYTNYGTTGLAAPTGLTYNQGSHGTLGDEFQLSWTDASPLALGAFQVQLLNGASPPTAIFAIIYGVTGTACTYYPKIPAAANIQFHPPGYRRINFNPPVTLKFRVRKVNQLEVGPWSAVGTIPWT